jgi:WD40 repeat protein
VRDPREDLKAVAFDFDSTHSAHITHIAAHPDGNLVLTAAKDHTLREHDLRMHETTRTFLDDAFRVGPMGCQPCYSPDGQYVASGSVSGAVVLWSAHSGRLETVLDGSSASGLLSDRLTNKGGHERDVTSCAWSGRGNHLLTVSKDRNFIIWG